MSLETVKKWYEFALQGDLENMLNLYTDDVEWIYTGQQEHVPYAGTYRAKTGLLNGSSGWAAMRKHRNIQFTSTSMPATK